MTVAGHSHDITLEAGGTVFGFQVRPGSFRKERADDFAPKIATGNDPAFREGIWDVWAQSGAPGGVDQLTFTDRGRILSSDGNVFLSRDQRIMLQAAWNSSDASKNATAPMLVDFSTGSDFIVAGVGTKVRRFDIGAGTWTDSTTTLAASCIWVHRHGTRMFAACGASQDFYSSTDLITFAQPSAGQKASGFTTWSKDGNIYLVLFTGTTIRRSLDNGVTWDAPVSVGNPDTNITGLGVAFGLLIIGKSDGLYTYDGVSVETQFTFPNQNYVGNCRALVYHEGFLYTHILANIVKLSISGGGIVNKVNITPEMIGDENKELYGHGTPIWIWSGPQNLYAAFDDGQSLYPEVLSYNGLGWQQEYLGASGDTMLAASYSKLGSRTIINDGATRYRKHPTLRDLPFPDYPATGSFVTSDFDGGLPWMYKAWRDVQVEAENISSGSILFEYSLDKGTVYTTLGTITQAGKTVLMFAGATSVDSQQFRLRVTITRNSSSSSPRLRRFAVTFLNRPNPIYAYTVQLKIAPAQVIRDQTAEIETVRTRQSFLDGAEASHSPVTFTDMEGDARKVFITKTSSQYLPESPATQGGATPPLWLYVNVNMIQVLTAGFYGDAYWDSATYA